MNNPSKMNHLEDNAGIEQSGQKTADFERKTAEAEQNFEVQLKKEGINLSEQDYQELSKVMPELLGKSSPKFQEYLQEYGPRIEALIKETNDLKTQGKENEALEKVTDFLDVEVDRIDKMGDPQVKEQIMSYLSVVLDLANTKEKLDSKVKMQLISTGVDLVPVIGSGKMLTEAALGKTMDGDKLTGGKRALHAVEGVAFLALDAVAVAGLLTGGVVSAGAEGTKVAVAGARSVEAGLKIGKTITRFAALVRKTGKLTKTSRTIFKVGQFVKKYPQLVGVIARLAKARKMQNKVSTVAKFKNLSEEMKSAPLAFGKDLKNQAIQKDKLVGQTAEQVKKMADVKEMNRIRGSLA